MRGQYWSRWRATASPIIARVLEETKGRSEKEIREALKLAYPFGERVLYPYKIWLDEIRRQMTGETTSLTKPRNRTKCGPQTAAYARAANLLREWENIYGRRSE
jgi:hypothetical protein